MDDNYTKRLPRLTAVLTQLQSKRFITAQTLADRFGVSTRTIYRDIRALEQAGIPILTEEGKGYSLMEGYRLPPVMFTEREALALVTVEQIILKQKDASLAKEFSEAIVKIKSVLRNSGKEKTELLEKQMYIGKNFENEITSHILIDIQIAISAYRLIKISYKTKEGKESERMIEPYILYHNPDEDWLLVAWCRLRNDFRVFRLDRIKKFSSAQESFTPQTARLKKFIEKKYLSRE
jgi:predicted DNA-binding transcriptional regulator YafY